MSIYNQKFGELLRQGISAIATYEQKNASAIDEELGDKIFRSAATIQHYKKGNIPSQKEAVETFAIEIVKRSVLEKRWARDFLASARHANVSGFITSLFPDAGGQASTNTPSSNLPAAMYRRFVMRAKPIEEIAAALAFQCSVVLITSLGGMGKTSLAREVADHCLHKQSAAIASLGLSFPEFSVCVWATNSDNTRPLSLSYLLDLIANAFEYKTYTQMSFREKLDRVDRLLRCNATLIVVENFDTVGDATLAEWLMTVPQPSKVIVTSRTNHLEFVGSAATVSISGMTFTETRDLMQSLLGAGQGGVPTLSDQDLTRLKEATGGNPKALQICAGLLAQPDQTLESVIEACQFAEGTLFDTIFARCWDLLGQDERNTLMSLSVFPFGATIEALAFATGICDDDLRLALRRLAIFSLIEVPFSTVRKVYSLHPIVHSLASGRLRCDRITESIFLERRLRYFAELAASVGFAWNELERLDNLDPDDVLRTVQLVLDWCLEHERFADYVTLSRDIRYYYYVRGNWGATINLRRAEAARQTGDFAGEFEALVYHLNIAAKQENLQEIERILPRVRALIGVARPTAQAVADLKHAEALCLLAQKQYATAAAIWEGNLADDFLSAHSRNANRRWLATCQFRSGEIDAAKANFSALLEDSTSLKFLRGVVSSRIHLAEIAIHESDFVAALNHLAAARRDEFKAKDRSFGANIAFLAAKIALLQCDLLMMPGAIENARQAAEDFDRLGNVERVKECQELLEALQNKTGNCK